MAIPFDNTAFSIRETTGLKREVDLYGRCMPFRPFTLEGTQRAEVTWYPGSPHGSVQMLGAKEEPTEVTGKWDDYFINDVFAGGGALVSGPGGSGQVEDAFELVKLFDSIRRQGSLVRVLWDEHERFGFLSSFRHEWHDRSKVEWAMTFTWIGIADAPLPALEGRPHFSAAVVSMASNLVPAIAVPFNPANAPTTAAGQFMARVARAVSGEVDDLQRAMGDLEALVDAEVDALLSPLQQSQRAVALLTSLGQRCEDVIAATMERSVETVFGAADATSALAIYGLDVTSRVSSKIPCATFASIAKSTRSSARAVRQLRVEEEQAQRDILNDIQPDILTFVRAVDNENLRDVSMRYYGRSDGWRYLMEYNDLDSSWLSAGQVIFIPKEVPYDQYVGA